MEQDKSRALIAIIVAAARNGVIGRGGAMPWHIPSDLYYFKDKTLGKPVIMGQKTWESLKRKPLPGRVNIVLTRQQDWRADGADTAHSLSEAIEIASKNNSDEIFIIGGGEIFRQALPLADTIYLTEIQADIEGDTLFKPDLSSEHWRNIEASPAQKNEIDSHSYRFLVYRRVSVAYSK